jgi:glycosyltransferase involved in cell wall biosynthesis
MRILIDATPLLMRSAGVKNYLYYWIRHLQAAKSDHHIDAFPWLFLPEHLNHDVSISGLIGTAARLGYVAAANFMPGIPLLDWASHRAALFHVSNQLRTPVRKTPVTATLYDLTCWLTPEFHTPDNIRADAAFAEQVWKRARGLIAISENTRRDAVRILGLPEHKIEVIYPGVPDEFFSVSKSDRADVTQRHQLSKPYVLFVGTIEPRKNVDLLLDAYAGMDLELRDEYDLVILGPTGWARPETIARLNSPPPGVRVLGYIPESDLPSLTAAATVAAYPSLYEGFGFPVAQAMAAGVPCVTSSVSALPEIAGNGALLVDPRSESEIRSALEALLRSPSLRSRLSATAFQRAQMFRWDAAALRSLAFFERIVG